MSHQRSFARALAGPGTAGHLRNAVSQAVKESHLLTKSKPIEPIDYETHLIKNKSTIHQDPQRELLMFPLEELVDETIPRELRTEHSSVPNGAESEATNLLAKECIKTYTSDWSLVHNKWDKYSGSYLGLPRTGNPAVLPEQVFETDTEEKEEEPAFSKSGSDIAKKGWLLKDSSSDSSGFSLSKSFKRRFCCLKRQPDCTYTLEFSKDEKKSDSKGHVFLDSAVDVLPAPKKGKYAFEIRMQDASCHLLAADSEAELQDWIATIKRVINTDSISQKSSKVEEDSISLNGKDDGQGVDYKPSGGYSDITRYMRESESILARERKLGRCELFDVYSQLPRNVSQKDKETDVAIFSETFINRFTVSLQEFRLKLQANLTEDIGRELWDNPEPFFFTFALYDAKNNRKLTENAYLDANSDSLYSMIPEELLKGPDQLNTVDGRNTTPQLRIQNQKWLSQPGKLLFSVSALHQDIYVVVLIDKVLQGAVSTAVEPYLKGQDPRTGTKVHKLMRQFCQHIGHYRMPFAWAAKPICRPGGGLDLTTGGLPIYRQDPTKLTEDDIVKHLADLNRPEKSSKWVVIPGTLQLNLEPMDNKEKVEGVLTPSLDVIKPFPLTCDRLPILEVEEFPANQAETAVPFTVYRNHLYIYPRNIKFDNVKNVKARNIACCVELRDSDEEGAAPLKCIYGKPRGNVFTSVASCSVIHHNTAPDFYEEIKIRLPVELVERHHILFTFYHVSCESSIKPVRQSITKIKPNVDSVVGYAWIPLMKQRRVCDGELTLPVAGVLPPGYLAHDHPGVSKISGPEMKWHDGCKQIFKFRMRLVSTVYTTDLHLHNFFAHCQKMQNLPNMPNENEAKNMLKALHAANITTVIQFLPTLLNQLFRLLPQANNEDVAFESVRVIAHFVNELCTLKKGHLLRSYIKYVFNAMDLCNHKVKSVHEELVKQLTALLRPNNNDFIVLGKFLKYSWFFFELITKGISQYLLQTGRIKMARHERFMVSKESNFVGKLETFIRMTISHIFVKYKDSPEETRNANLALSQFIKRLFTLMDRGFVFKLICMYMENFGLGDPKVLQEYKFEFIKIVCSHEHYIQLSLPTLRPGYARSRDVQSLQDAKQDYSLTDEYRQKHFLSGLLLQEFKSAINEIREVRRVAIATLRNQLAKHAWDDRYKKPAFMGRIASLYLPLFHILLENKNRLVPRDNAHTQIHSNRNSVLVLDNSDAMSLDSGLHAHNKSNSLPGSYSNRVSVASEQSTTSAKDSGILAMIAGQSPGVNVSLKNIKSDDLSGSRSSVASDDSTSTIDAKDTVSLTGGASIRNSTAAPNSSNVRYDKLDSSEVKDLLLCLLFVVNNMPEDVLIQWMNNTSESDLADFFNMLDICLHQFWYIGKKKLTSMSALSASYSSRKTSASVPSRRGDVGKHLRQSGAMTEMDDYLKYPEQVSQLMMEGNLVAEVGAIVLDVLSLYTQNFKQHLLYRDGDNVMLMETFDLHMSFLRANQPQQTLKHCFGLIRMFIGKFQQVLFRGKAAFCGRLCYELLRSCNSTLYDIRLEACITIYFLIRANYDFTKKNSFSRVKLQMMVAVSQLINDIDGVTGSRFQESLAIVNNYANKDKTMAKTSLVSEVNELTKRIRIVLMATDQMKDHQKDPEKFVDLQYSLAKQYASSPELRTTWLQNMAARHESRGDFSEAAHCYLHIAGAVAEFLKQMGMHAAGGCSVLRELSRNIEGDESTQIDDRAVIEELQFTEETLVQMLEQAAAFLVRAERYEMLGSLYRIVIPVYEKERDLEKLADCYSKLHEAYKSAVEANRSGKRILGTYFRVAFFGQHFEDDDGKEYIYKEPKLTTLPEICERLKNLYGEKFGHQCVKILQESKQVNRKELDPQIAHIQVTFVTPFFDERELLERKTDFERNNNVCRFMFQTPFTQAGKAHGAITEQFMRKTTLSSAQAFPYVKKRIPVSGRSCVELSPIEVAIDEMKTKVSELNILVTSSLPDLKKLQLKLQGAVSAQVNAGPMAYAEAFLSPGAQAKLKLSGQHVEELKNIFREFVSVCTTALELNSRLIDSEQFEYHESLKTNFKTMSDQLADILPERLLTEVMNALSLEQRNSLLLNSSSSV